LPINGFDSAAAAREAQKEGVMIDVERIKRKIKICMFDQYGTVVDMQGGSLTLPHPS
jgi:hypothetical protein